MIAKNSSEQVFVLFSAILLSFISCNPGLTYGVEERIALEQELSRRVEGITKAVLGTDRVFVWVEIVVAPEASPTTKDESLMRKQLDNSLPGIDSDYVPVLLKSSWDLTSHPGKNNQSSLTELAQTFKLPADFVQRLTVNILVSDKISLKTISELRNIIAVTVGIDEVRGDKIIIQPIPFKKGGSGENTKWKNAVMPLILWTAGLGIFAVFLFGPVARFLKDFNHAKHLPVTGSGSASSPHGASPQSDLETGRWTLTREFPRETALSLPQTLINKSKLPAEPAYNPFSFVNESNIGNLCLLLHDESPEIVSIVANYLAPDFSSQLINSLSGEIQSQVVLFMAQPRLLERDELRELARSVKENVELICGGINNVTKIIEKADPETRENLLQFMESNLPEIALQIRDKFAKKESNVTFT